MKRVLYTSVIALSLGACAAAPAPSTTTAPASTATTVPAPSADPLAQLRSFTLADLQAASADAKAQTPPDVTASQCYDFLAANLPTLPNFNPSQPVGAILAFQKVRDINNGAVAQNGFLKGLNLACAALVNDTNVTLAKLGIIAAGTAATGGALAPAVGGLGAIGPTLPIPLP